MTGRVVTAGVLLIGDELLSGRTQDTNLQTIAQFIGPLGVQVREARVVSDEQADIVAGLNALRGRYDYVFTTGGIGPTHDDITADAVAAAFGLPIDERADALEVMEAHYGKSLAGEENALRRRMARIPEGGTLIVNPVSGAPGFQVENVFVMAGVPKIMRGMLEDVAGRLEGGVVTQSVTVGAPGLREGDMAAGMADIQETFGVQVGSYPWFTESSRGVNMVARGPDADALERAAQAMEELVRAAGGTPERG